MAGHPFDDEPEPFTREELMDIAAGQASFAHFLGKIFPASFEQDRFLMADGKRHPFSLSRLHFVWAGLAQKYSRLCVIAPRMHLKSTVLNNAFSLWQLFKARAFVDGLIVSYKDDLAADHVAIAKRLAKSNRYFRFFSDLKPMSEHVISFECSFGLGESWTGVVEGIGIRSAKRGKHPKFVVCDDILSDFANPLNPAELKKIDVIFNTVIQSLPMPDEPLILVGTPQSYDDTLYKLRRNPEFYWMRCPAEVNPEQEPDRVAWPERFSPSVLRRQRRRVGLRAYQVEYLLIPFMAVNSFLPRPEVEAAVSEDLSSWPLDVPFDNPDHWPVYGGMDIGKEVHPTHISIAVQAPNGDLIQVYQEFLDHLNYASQARLVNRLTEHFQVTKFLYDATRAELDDRGLTRRIMGVKITRQKKVQMALLLERVIVTNPDEPKLSLIPDIRQVNQICAVDPKLMSIETSEGHGDSFWSNALMVRAAMDGPAIVDLGGVNDMFSGPRLPRKLSR